LQVPELTQKAHPLCKLHVPGMEEKAEHCWHVSFVAWQAWEDVHQEQPGTVGQTFWL
jgi:hypothetical protein